MTIVTDYGAKFERPPSMVGMGGALPPWSLTVHGHAGFLASQGRAPIGAEWRLDLLCGDECVATEFHNSHGAIIHDMSEEARKVVIDYIKAGRTGRRDARTKAVMDYAKSREKTADQESE